MQRQTGQPTPGAARLAQMASRESTAAASGGAELILLRVIGIARTTDRFVAAFAG
jgi:hypothetical protein